MDNLRMVLSLGAGRLLTVRFSEGEWHDLGDPGRVTSTLLESGVELPVWAKLSRSARETKQGPTQRMSMAVAVERPSPAISLRYSEH
jgi:hypothetical protein